MNEVPKVLDKERRNKVTISVGDAFVNIESDDDLEKCKVIAEEMINKISEKKPFGGHYG